MEDGFRAIIFFVVQILRKGGKPHVQENAEERPRFGRIRVDSCFGRYRDYHHSVGPWSRHRQRFQPDRQQHLADSRITA